MAFFDILIMKRTGSTERITLHFKFWNNVMIISTSLFLFIHKISKFIYCIRYIDITIDMIEKLLLFSGNHFLQ